MAKPLLIIVGPTAVGKTETAVTIAKKINGEIISADSIQVYKHLNIGSAKPSFDERENISHYLMDEIDPRENFSVAEFQKRAKECIDYILQKGKIPIIAGGTGLYVNSIIYNLDFTQTSSNWELRKQLEAQAKEYGNAYLHDQLAQVDSESAKRIHVNNVKRVIRALEVFHNGGEGIKDFQEGLIENPEYQYVLIGLTRDRKELYDRINKRVDILIDNGLIDEVKGLLNLGLDEDNIAMKGLGYKEMIGYLKGHYSLDEAINILKRDTRHYAKRQITWFKRYEKIQWFNFDNYSSKEILAYEILKYVEGKLDLV